MKCDCCGREYEENSSPVAKICFPCYDEMMREELEHDEELFYRNAALYNWDEGGFCDGFPR